MRKTYSTPQPSWIDQTYTRSREDNRLVGAPYDLAGGSSPLTRGKRRERVADGAGQRLIPAHAGKTTVTKAVTDIDAAHPRSRGENTRVACQDQRCLGSSPLTRGKRYSLGPSRRSLGLIPAHAGKTPTPDTEKGQGDGSSPLTRGKLTSALPTGMVDGLIPAHAGKTDAGVGCGGCAAAHPRSRGENAGLLRKTA